MFYLQNGRMPWQEAHHLAGLFNLLLGQARYPAGLTPRVEVRDDGGAVLFRISKTADGRTIEEPMTPADLLTEMSEVSVSLEAGAGL